jgi:hypothetical protein
LGKLFFLPFRLVNKKPIQPKPEEIKNNPRSRSARLRICRENINQGTAPQEAPWKLNGMEAEQNIQETKRDWKKIFSYRWIVKNVPFFLFLAVLAVVYIYNGHYADKTIGTLIR